MPNAERDAEAAAKRAFVSGVEALRTERWVDAEVAFRRSLLLVRRESVLYDLALSLYMQRRLRECAAILEDVFRANGGGADSSSERNAQLLMSRILAEKSQLRLQVTPRSAAVRIDGDIVPARPYGRSLEVFPGSHEAEATARGYVARRVSLTTSAGTALEVSIALDRVPANPPPKTEATARPLSAPHTHGATMAPWLFVGVGAALLVGGSITGMLALKADDALERGCPTNRDCDPSLRHDRDRALALGRATDVLFVSGGILVMGGVAWRFLVPTPTTLARREGLFVGVTGNF